MSFLLLAIADPNSALIKSSVINSAVSRIPPDVRLVISDNPEELKAHAAEADAILYAHGQVSLLVGVLPIATRVRWIHSLWTGVESILTPEMLAHPAPLTNGRGVFRWPLADWVVGVMLHFAFDFGRVLQQQEEKVWKPFVSTTLDGRTLGIVGYGAIGSAVAQRVHPFGVKIGALRRRPELSQDETFIHRSYGPTQLRELMSASDYVLVATPLTAETRGLIGEGEIAAMKPHAVLINIGRGPVVHEGALIRALQSGAIRGAALDVFDTEPLPQEHPFWGMRQVFLSPHTADRVEGFLGPAFDCFLDNLARFAKGSSLINVVDKRAGY
jgi:phosphoglycerate dehydrogenase-like enzyme